jgi:hypothetical protein
MTTTKHIKLTVINEILRYNLYYFLIKFLLIKIQIIKFSNTFKQNSLGWLIMVVRNLTGQAQLFLNIFISWFCCLIFNGFTEEKLQLFLLTLVIGKGDGNCSSWELTQFGNLQMGPSRFGCTILERIQKLIIHPARSY